MKEGNPLRGADNNALLGLIKPPAVPVVLTKPEEAFSDSYIFGVTSYEKLQAQFLVGDFAKFSLKEDDLQVERFSNLQNCLMETLQNCDISKIRLVILPTGDGVIVAAFGAELNPIALKLALGLLERLRKHELHKELRIGVHFGPVYHLIGDKGESQVIGPGINKAVRVETAGKPGRILVSDDYYNMFLDRAGDSFCLRLTKDNPTEYRVKKEPSFRARFVSDGDIGNWK